MFSLVVQMEVRPGRREEFLAGMAANAEASVRDEPGCLRFDVHQQVADPTRFLLHEIYADEAAFHEQHRSAPHYAAWREVADQCVLPGTHVNTFARPLLDEGEEGAR